MRRTSPFPCARRQGPRVQRVCHVLPARHPDPRAGRAHHRSEILDYIEYAKEKGCSMTGPENPEIERLNVLKEDA